MTVMRRTEPMTLHQAMLILSEVHTQDDHEIGFTVQIGASPHMSVSRYQQYPGDYVEAWRVVRVACGLPTEMSRAKPRREASPSRGTLDNTK